MHSYQDIFKNKTKILFVTAHPDDVDVSWAGTIAKLTADGKEVFVLVVTNGARGSRENVVSEKTLAKERLKEQKNAMYEVGVPPENVETLDYKDGEAQVNMELIGKIAYHIRKFKPDLVATQDPQTIIGKFDTLNYVNHKDHRITGLATIDAVYPFSRDLSFFPEHQKENITPHTVMELLLMGDTPNTEIDITEVIDQKRKALLAHASQFNPNGIEKMLERRKKDGKYFEKGNYIKLAW